ncbi:hypothetical protein [Natronosalvus rutilus]|uniref:DUF7988 domain-containing protein n=1 Tax=Natronosalvus rutilus TaxID=2953753 RepID=A0A9E7N9Q1_9EURY|nr:hypothetical protein [Natronosalvus rutilus]UTF53386.1 hypothetical protein NGM29_16700 [Natronosalvus rutilus]
MSRRATTRAIERRLRDEHGGILRRLEACADAVSEAWPAETVTERTAVVDPLRAEIEASGLLRAFPPLLVDLVESAGYALPARPVAAPPYVAVTSRGPVLRATVEPGRLVVRLDVFGLEREREHEYQCECKCEPERDSGPAYRRLESVSVSAELR